MTLTIFDPRTGTQVKVWFPDTPREPQPTPARVIPHPGAAGRRKAAFG
ncbi:hypothetical protein [Methylobacterium isbiliense]|jgi:hypothetical protein|uniref:Uncharacterized protein n=1 Tax=Methylobacterium isbiliense TaxID=315478 RepID=A0ABQ4SB59_9HYPH|nr:hypothetical protein [Methylobacterium isbiliense]MDN3625398.1 hypothetical protein [Methylobacterium isbiliense]GJD99685.1 hypothetical protein GMJLKIPL_1603 [Methylobacterium isbiliense]